MRKIVAASAVAAVTLGIASPALAAGLRTTGAGGPIASNQNCITVDKSVVVNGAGVRTGSHQVCESHDVSDPKAGAVSVSYRLGDPAVVAPEGDAGADPLADAPSFDEVVSTVCGLRHSEWRDGDPTDLSDAYRRLVECLGFTVYENTQCSPPAHQGESDLQCWATDYLVGDYVRNALVDWVERVLPVPLPAPVKDAAQGVFDTIVDVTNGDTSGLPSAPAAPAPAVPGIPGLPIGDEGAPGSPPAPDVDAMVADLMGQIGRALGDAPAAPGAPEAPNVDDIRDLLGTAANDANDAVDEAFSQVFGHATSAGHDALDAVDQAARDAERQIDRARRMAERLVRDSGQADKVDSVKREIGEFARQVDRTVQDRINFLRRHAGL